MTARSRKIGNLMSDDASEPKKTLDDVFAEAKQTMIEAEKAETPPVEVEKEEKSEEIVKETPKIPEKKEKTTETGTKNGVFVPPEMKNAEDPGFDPNAVVVTDRAKETEEALKAILNVQKGKRAVPTLVTFYSANSRAIRHVIVDVTDSIVEEAWAKYKEMMGYQADDEEFMGLLYKILDIDIPRMYRAVAHGTLKR